MATSSATPIMDIQKGNTPNPMANGGDYDNDGDTEMDTDNDGDSENSFMSEFIGRLQKLSIPQLNMLEKLLVQADPRLIVTVFPEFSNAMQIVIQKQGGGSQNMEAATQQAGSQPATPSQYPGTPMPSAPSGLRGQFLQKSQPIQ